ncbi:calcium-binding protein [Leptolyngbya sp. AN02str]|uniref:calcium-binding protein n=1 Tax=Leptolyngbya sp. AN02str TaxID=3423363 RepID=UPI003D3117D7
MAILSGNAFNNLLDAISYGNSNDTLYGYGGNDTLYGWNGNDKIYAGTGNDYAYGEAGNDYIDGWYGNDYISGGSGNDTLLGYYGNDTIYGGSGTDKIFGEAGNDVMHGGGYGNNSYEYDEMTGGAGADTFVVGDAYGNFYKGAGYAIIKDFNYAEGDKVKLNLSQYEVKDVSYYGVGSSALDTVIYHKGTTDVVAVIQDKAGAAVIPSLDFVSA